jgi:hypothetical protein
MTYAVTSSAFYRTYIHIQSLSHKITTKYALQILSCLLKIVFNKLFFPQTQNNNAHVVQNSSNAMYKCMDIR